MERGSVTAGRFKAAFAAAEGNDGDWASIAKACIEELGDLPQGANLGFLYATDVLADDLGSILTFLRERSGIEHWVGTIGIGIVGNGVEFYNRPAVSCLVASMTEDTFRLFSPVVNSVEKFQNDHGEWIGRNHPTLGVVHGDPRNQDMTEIIEDLSEATSAFLVGGLTSSRGESPQVAGSMAEGGLSGVLFASDQIAVAALTQGCSPIGPVRRVTSGEGSIIKTIDDRPAVEILKEDIGELLARDIKSIGGYIYVSFPIAASDTGDYLVRNLLGIDEMRGWIQVGDVVTPGMAVSFCRRDNETAIQDLKRMLSDITARAGTAPRAGLYYSCIARGRHLFGPDAEEMQEIRAQLGDIPITGFFANGEISNNRLYGYTGVLTLLF
jgi:small ligand-binding sensory domain FIST